MQIEGVAPRHAAPAVTLLRPPAAAQEGTPGLHGTMRAMRRNGSGSSHRAVEAALKLLRSLERAGCAAKVWLLPKDASLDGVKPISGIHAELYIGGMHSEVRRGQLARWRQHHAAVSQVQQV